MGILLKIHAFWDEEANVWVAESDDVPGLVTEAPAMPELIAKLKVMVPEMLEENGHLKGSAEIPFEVMASYKEIAVYHAH